MTSSRRRFGRVRSVGLTTLLIATIVTATPAAASAAATCIFDGDGTFIKEICITAPDNGATVSGIVGVTGTVDPVNGPRTQKVEFYLDGEYVLTDFRSSSNSSAIFDFELPTELWVDGTHRLEMLAITRADETFPQYVTARVGIDLVFDNGITEIPPNTNTFTPSPGRTPAPGEPFTIAAVGDGASGEPNAEAVADLLVAQDPNMFLYLGDVYEKGTKTEFHNWYGDETRSWGRLRSITNPTIGNHEYEDGEAPGYFDYWDNVPDYYSFDVAGWHVISLNSTSRLRNDPDQFAWLAADIASSDARCTIAYWHDPRWSIGTQGDEPNMDEEWRLLVAAGVDIFVGANDHNYQRWERLDADGALDPNGAVQFVAGTGGHGIRPFEPGESEANPRVARASDSLDAFGALFLDLHPDRADFRFLQTNGGVLDSGSIPCVQPGFRGELETIRDTLAGAIPTLTGKAADKAAEAVKELDKTLTDETQWDVDGAPSNTDGKGVFDKMKKAVERLLEVSEPPPPITAAIDGLATLAGDMAQAEIDDRAAAGADPARLLLAAEHMAKAADKLAKGEPDKAVDEYKKAWEDATKAAIVAAVGFRGDLVSVAADLAAAHPGLSGKAADKAREAVTELSKAYLDDAVWDPDGSPSDALGDEAFAKMKRAVEKLLEVKEPPPPITAAVDALVTLARDMAQQEIDEAAGGDANALAKAQEHMAKAAQKLANGEPHKAIDEYKKAWENARDAA